MKIFEEKPLTSFEWWGNAKDNVCELTREEMDTLEFHLEDLYPDGIGSRKYSARTKTKKMTNYGQATT